MQSKVPSKKLNTGYKIPMVGLGVWKNDNSVEEMQELLQKAFDVGYRHIDTAIAYENEEVIGEALENIFKKGQYKREDIFITSKCFPKKDENIKDMVKKSLSKLKTKYLDLYLLHWSACPIGDNLEIKHKPVHEVWKELEECVDQKLIRSIGVSNYNVQSLFDLLSYAKIKPAMNQIELHAYLQQPDLIAFCKKFDIQVTAYSPIGRGKLLEDEQIKKIAEKYHKTPAQIALHYLNVNLDLIVIPKTANPERLKENIDWQDFKLEKNDVEQLKKLDQDKRFVKPNELFDVPLFD